MKKVLITLMSLLVLLVTLNNLQAQDKKEQHKVHVKVKKIVNGKETIVDSVFTVDGDVDLEVLMESIGHDKTMGELHKHKKVEKEIKVESRVERKIIKKGDGEEEIKIEFEIQGEGEQKGNVYMFKSDEGDEPISIKIDGDNSGKQVFIMKSEDGEIIEIIEMDEKNDKSIVIIKSGDDVDVKKIIKSGKGKMIWYSDDEKVIELDKDDLKKKEMIIIQKSGEGEVEILDEEIQKMLKEKGIDWNEMNKDDMTIKKTSNINVNIASVNDEDKEALKKMGVDEQDFANDLEVGEMTLKVENEGTVIIQVKTEESGNLSVVLRDTVGEVISKTVLKESSNAYKVYLNPEESGTYYVTLAQDGKSLTQKLLIKKA